MKLAFVIRKDCVRCAKIVKRVTEILPENWECIYDTEVAKYLNVKGKRLENISADIIITVGGDGTALRALQLAQGPILGINMGGLGFLTQIEIGDVERSVYKIIRGEYKIEKNLKLKVTINGQEVRNCTNEVVVHTSKISKIRKFNIYIGDNFIDGTSADGVIVATPIGSTSYSFSAGGPILLPNLNAMVVSYLAPFGPRARPIVVPAGEEIQIKLIGKEQESVVILDGQAEFPVTSVDEIKISVSDKKAEFVSIKDSFYTRIREKLIKNVVN